MADVLRNVRSLRTVDLTRTRVGPRGAAALAAGLAENLGLQQLVLSGNPLTVAGAKALLRAVRERNDGAEADPPDRPGRPPPPLPPVLTGHVSSLLPY